MRTKLVYDLPTRIFHLIFALLFVTAFVIAKTIDDESPVYAFHMLAGLLMGVLVILRIIWGFAGSEHSRFLSLDLRPSSLLSYFKGIFSGDKKTWTGHNPASSWVLIVMLFLAGGLASTGILMSRGMKEDLEDVHELFAHLFLLTVFLHISGVILHSLRHRDGIALAMFDGKKIGPEMKGPAASPRPLAALALIFIMGFSAAVLVKSFHQDTGSLRLGSFTLQLMEIED